MMMSKLHVFRY